MVPEGGDACPIFPARDTAASSPTMRNRTTVRKRSPDARRNGCHGLDWGMVSKCACPDLVVKSLDRTKVFCYITRMDIEIRLYATFRDFLPPGSSTFSMTKSLDRAMTIADVVKDLGLPEDIPKIVIVNGAHAEFDYVLKEGDILSVFPPLAGG